VAGASIDAPVAAAPVPAQGMRVFACCACWAEEKRDKERPVLTVADPEQTKRAKRTTKRPTRARCVRSSGGMGGLC
jgi:hypothetical protein